MSPIVVGGGIGGLTAALALHAVGESCIVFEQSLNPRELGVGINLLPPAVEVLAKIGLLEELDRAGIRTGSLIFTTKSGQVISRTSRGLDAGFDFPQISIHRGRLFGVLLQAMRRRLGRGRFRTGCRLVDIRQQTDCVIARFEDQSVGKTFEQSAPYVIGADGLRSTVRALLNPAEKPPRWSGYLLWRGAVDWPRWEDGRTMFIAGGMAAKFVFYPIAQTGSDGARLTNWAMMMEMADGMPSTILPDESWSRQANRFAVEEIADRTFDIGFVDIKGLIAATPEIFEFPLLDREPLERWTHGRISLLGDAAHPMYPVGSNGATQAILDADCLSKCVAEAQSSEYALRKYETRRRRATTSLMLGNRAGGPERIIDLVEARAPDGFDDVRDILSPRELSEFGLLDPGTGRLA